jgi:flagellar basal body-associated protein FliL
MRSLFSNKKGMATIPIRTSGRKRKGSIFLWIIGIIGVVFLVMFSAGFYKNKIQPWLTEKKIPSSLESGTGGTNTLEGSETPQYLDRPDAASFTSQVLDNANGNAVISAGIALGARSKTTNANGTVTYKEWLNPSSANTTQTITTIPEDTVLTFYGGSSTYYLYPLTDRKISIGDVVTLNGATIQAESSMAVVVYDDTKATALSAADITAAHDYKLTLGEGQTKTIYIKLSNNGADKRYDLKAICTGAAGTNVSSFEIVDTDWTSVKIPTFIDNSQVSVNLTEASAVTDEDFDRCYVYKVGTNEVIRLDEWEDAPLIKATVNSKTGKNPTDDVVFFTALDGAWARGSDSVPYFDFYQHDADEGNVGLTETATSPLGKQLGAIIELD